MSRYSHFVDPTSFEIVSRYLNHPQGSIDYVLHVKSREEVPLLAERLARDLGHQVSRPEQFEQYVRGLVTTSDVLITTRNPLPDLDPARQVPVNRIPRNTTCMVIYLPPFYLSHTQGLFEGKLPRPRHELPPAIVQAMKRKPGLKI